jgi:hypothetical protein
MATWQEIETDAPDFAVRVRHCFEAGTNKTIATLRVALHSPTIEPPKDEMSAWPGDAKLAGTLVETAPPAGDPDTSAGSFKLDITEVVLTYVGKPADHLVIESWHPGRGWQRRTRR